MYSLYEQFRQSFGRDGPDYTIVENAVGKERENLESDLIANLGYFEALALGLIKSQQAVPELKQLLNGGTSQQRSAAGRALWDIEGDATYLAPITAIIVDSESGREFEKIAAIGLLLNVNHQSAFDALEHALFDPEYLVRTNAASIYLMNATGRVDDRTVYRNVTELDHSKIARFAQRLRAKIQIEES